MNTNKLITEREKTHGKFSANSDTTEMVMDVFRGTPRWDQTPAFIKVAVFMIVHKLSRALNGQLFFDDHWKDIQGYAKLVEDECTKPPKQIVLYSECPHCFAHVPRTLPNGICPHCSTDLMIPYK